MEQEFEKYGKIKSLKISFNPDHSSRGYGFICFQEEESATKAVAACADSEVMKAAKFEPKDSKKISRKLNNNLYFKNIPTDHSQDQVREMFAPFGTIKSLVIYKNEKVENSQYGFVCFDDKEGVNKEYGPECCQNAITELNNRVVGKDSKGAEIKLYVRHALKKTERQMEKTRDTIRYKASKKRCNLYVKNFPGTWTQDDLTNLFQQYGEIEKIRLEKGQTGNSYAFVCFKQPDAAATAKSTLHNQTYDGKVLIINHYEIKEVRDQ
jgi:polyadenylate-binding protein